MIKVNKLKSKNPFLKVIFEIINLVISLVVGILNLFISFGKWFYNKLIKEYSELLDKLIILDNEYKQTFNIQTLPDIKINKTKNIFFIKSPVTILFQQFLV